MSGQTNFGNTNISLFLFTTIDAFLPCWEFHIVNDHLINPIPDSVWHKMLFLSAEDLPIHEFKFRGSKRYPEPPENKRPLSSFFECPVAIRWWCSCLHGDGFGSTLRNSRPAVHEKSAQRGIKCGKWISTASTNNELKLKSGKGEIFLLTKNSKNNGGIFLFAQFLVLQPMLVLDRVSANFPDIIFSAFHSWPAHPCCQPKRLAS